MKFFCLFRGKSRLLKTIPYIIFPGSPSTPWQARGQPSGADHHQTSPSGAQQHHFSISFAVMNNYQAAAAAQAQAQGFGPPASPHTTGARAGFPAANSPGPTIDMYNSSGDSVGYAALIFNISLDTPLLKDGPQQCVCGGNGARSKIEASLDERQYNNAELGPSCRGYFNSEFRILLSPNTSLSPFFST
ncbi:unnamed protein product [Psylliodes chrysocephalus]|uniref:Uncharacterized protein n=1 Tax=Psylliodes chrysocephalus TaxID=3402493 RepID=A0A9P0D434_9CUCU|nr:unnamed protein product [Psylliodes chrysocephala]